MKNLGIIVTALLLGVVGIGCGYDSVDVSAYGTYGDTGLDTETDPDFDPDTDLALLTSVSAMVTQSPDSDYFDIVELGEPSQLTGDSSSRC